MEVKSPLRVATADGMVHEFDDSDILKRCIADASKQLSKETRNLVMLVGRLTLGVSVRRFFVKAFYGAEKWIINRETLKSRIEFDLTGKFVKEWPGGQQNRRVGGVLFVQEELRSSESFEGAEVYRADHDALMMHNPFAYHTLPEEPWTCSPQFVLRGDVMEWTDGYPAGGPTPS